MKLLLTGVLALLMIGLAGTARADLDEKDVAKVVQLKSENKNFDRNLGSYPAKQIVGFGVGGGWEYFIDVYAQLCMLREAYLGTGQLVIVPCKSLKKGYPLIAPLITWDD